MGTSYGSVLMIEYFDIATTNFWINVRCLHECNPSLAFFATKWGYWANNCWKYKQTNLKYLLRILPILPRAYRRTIRSCLLFCKHGHYRAVEVCCGGRQNDWFAMLIGLWPCEMPFGHLAPRAHRKRPIFFFFFVFLKIVFATIDSIGSKSRVGNIYLAHQNFIRFGFWPIFFYLSFHACSS